MAKVLSPDDLYREEVLDARKVPPHRRIALGLELYERARTFALAGIRNQFPEADEATILHKWRESLALLRDIESREVCRRPKM